MTEALQLEQSDIDWLNQRVPPALVQEAIREGEFVIVEKSKVDDNGNKNKM